MAVKERIYLGSIPYVTYMITITASLLDIKRCLVTSAHAVLLLHTNAPRTCCAPDSKLLHRFVFDICSLDCIYAVSSKGLLLIAMYVDDASTCG